MDSLKTVKNGQNREFRVDRQEWPENFWSQYWRWHQKEQFWNVKYSFFKNEDFFCQIFVVQFSFERLIF